MLFPILSLRNGKVLKLISWKHSFKRLNEEYEIAKKKKEALDNLFEKGRISQATRDSFDSDINAVLTEIEKQQNQLLAKMQTKTQELETQIKTLETLLANYEIQHVVGEIDEEMYQREITLLSTGLESARNELNTIQEATNQLSPPPSEAPVTESTLPVEENIQNETEEIVSDAATEVQAPTEPYSLEPATNVEETEPEAPAIEGFSTPEETPQIVEEVPEITEEIFQTEETMPQVTEELTQEAEPEIMQETLENVNEATEVTEERSQNTEEIASQPETTEQIPQVTQDMLEETELQPQSTENPSQDMNETPEVTVDNEVTEEPSENVEEIANQPEITEEPSQPEEEIPQVIVNEPQSLEETLGSVEETPVAFHPSEASKETPQEISCESIADEDQSSEETAEADDEAEYEEI
jgi:hypothetical protein